MDRLINEANRELDRIGGMPYGLARTQAAERQLRIIVRKGPTEP